MAEIREALFPFLVTDSSFGERRLVSPHTTCHGTGPGAGPRVDEFPVVFQPLVVAAPSRTGLSALLDENTT